jgi:UDP-N-acetylmuramyl pentapeptide phosphotransferase/UDP-N-acetylglucosamine-1-phosphate transferase
MIALVSRPGVAAFVAALLCTSCVRSVCRQLKLYDVPGPLKIHSQPIPRLGGVAIALALFTEIFLTRDFRAFLPGPILASLAVVWVAGLIDDVGGLPSLRHRRTERRGDLRRSRSQTAKRKRASVCQRLFSAFGLKHEKAAS